MNTSDQPTAEQAAIQVQLGEHSGNDAELKDALPTIAEQVNKGSSGTWKAAEYLGLIVQGGCWVGKAAWIGIIFIAERLSNYNERQANSDKTRKEGEALLVKAKADAALVNAKARTERAKAKEQEIKNESAAVLLEMIKACGIDLAAEVRDGQLHVAVVKDQQAIPLPAEKRTKEVSKKPHERKKGQ